MASSNASGLSSVIAALLVAAAAAVPLVWAATNGATDGSTPTAVDVIDTPPTTLAVEVVPVTETVVIAPDPIEVDGLPESVVRALEAAGNVREESRTELRLPASIVDVLVEHGVVLQVAEEGAP
jgi:hypothetical protein